MFDFLRSTSASASQGASNPVHWDDAAGPSQIITLPQISTTPFDFLSHIGVIVIEDEVYADTNLTLAQKLLTGKIFEHPGPKLKQARYAVGKVATLEYVTRIFALEFVGYTNLDNLELDHLRMCKALSFKPRYQSTHHLKLQCKN